MYLHERERPQKPKEVVPFPQPSIDEHGWPWFRNYLQSRELDPVIARLNGWYPSTNAGDTYKRIVIPAEDSRNLGFWQARLIDNQPLPVNGGALPPLRYQSPPGYRGDAVVVCDPTLLNPTRGAQAALFEGPTDAMAAACLGVYSIAMMGNTPAREAIAYANSLLLARNPEIVYLIPDRDAPGFGSYLCQSLCVTQFRVKIVFLDTVKDFCTLPKHERKTIFQT